MQMYFKKMKKIEKLINGRLMNEAIIKNKTKISTTMMHTGMREAFQSRREEREIWDEAKGEEQMGECTSERVQMHKGG